MKTLNFLVWHSVKAFCVLLLFLTPYIAIAADRIAFFERGYISNGGEMLVPLFCFVIIYLLLKLEDHLHKNLKEQQHENKAKRQTLL